MNIYLQGRKINIEHRDSRPPVEVLHLICKLRWMGMDEEAEQVQMQLRETTATGGVITAMQETD